MGRGYAKHKNALKKQFLTASSKLIEELQRENEALKTDPDSIVGQLIPKFRLVVSQNKKLNVLAATLIKMLGDKVVVTRAAIEEFEGKAINIVWEMPEGVDDYTKAEYYTFAYEEMAETLEPAPEESVDLHKVDESSAVVGCSCNEREMGDVQDIDETHGTCLQCGGVVQLLPPLSSINLYHAPNFVAPVEAVASECPGIDLGDGNASGCDASAGDCPVCEDTV
jgi:hypothetical protein